MVLKKNNSYINFIILFSCFFIRKIIYVEINKFQIIFLFLVIFNYLFLNIFKI